ncbi:haloacid dehalogenase type 3 [Halococcus morrhuae DSM 1307]|uniref:Haloacid dehalogenase type 3 n=1 Tax=Halococcus morrhuae DSM 1307 TaxID=931277 RepID=M0MEL9_HALMO|nr:haloacid dehalogenase type 3 [Halococcus morrhuae DSM 1307]
MLDHVIRTDELVFDRGEAAAILRIVSALNRLATLD